MNEIDMKNEDAVVLLSGGQDSTTCFAWAKARYARVHAMTILYGQRHVSEIEAAKKIALLLGATSHKVVDASVIGTLSKNGLTDLSMAITPAGGFGDVHAPGGLPTSFVPGRNMIFLAMASAHAVAIGAKTIVTGVCETDFSGYPDCREEFIAAMELTVNRAMPSSSGPICILTPLMHRTKAETVRMAREYPGCWDALALSVTCYHGMVPGCGNCPACALRVKGFREAGFQDPAEAATIEEAPRA